MLRLEVAAARARKGWTQTQLAQRLDDLGAHLDRRTVSRIEAGDRGVTVDELLALALALDLSPVSLLVPRTWREDIEITPNRVTTQLELLQWLRAARLPLVSVPYRPEQERFFDESRPDVENAALAEWPELKGIVTEIAELLYLASLTQVPRSVGQSEPAGSEGIRAGIVLDRATAVRNLATGLADRLARQVMRTEHPGEPTLTPTETAEEARYLSQLHARRDYIESARRERKS